MQRFTPQITYYLEMFHRGDTDNAFHGLLEIDRDALSELMAVLRSAQDVGVRELLVEVIGEYREQASILFLGEALLDTELRIWQQALNGLVKLASPAALDVLRAARMRQFPTQRETEDFQRWLEEAIEQTEAREYERPHTED